MKIDTDDFRVRPGKKLELADWPTRVKPYAHSKKAYQSLLAEYTDTLNKLQAKLYAGNQYAVLFIFQAMDAAGKDGAIKHVMSGVNPQGCQVYRFKHPSAEELDHDILRRTTRCLPERGRIGMFNRSYYEEVLIVRVHPELLRAEGLPDKMSSRSIWKERFRSIGNFEKHLHRNGTHVVKFFLHVSKEEQRKRFLGRIDDPEKNWKFNATDVDERRFWDDYMRAYEACMRATSTVNAPWYVVPADDKPNARVIISRIVVETLASLKLSFPETTDEHRVALQAIRKQLLAD
jgi:PPK2 family polyphosphate:nucleotide phosphotransferase